MRSACRSGVVGPDEAQPPSRKARASARTPCSMWNVPPFRAFPFVPIPGQEWLNYHHLLYFWVVAKEGSIVRASQQLRLAHPTISGQIHRLEEVLGEKLFAHKGRNLVLTEAGHVAFRYEDEIFFAGPGVSGHGQGSSERAAGAPGGRGF